MQWIHYISILLFILGSTFATSHAQEDSLSEQPTELDICQSHLEAGHWTEAADFDIYCVNAAVQRVWINSEEDEPATRDALRRDLLDFFFRHQQFAWIHAEIDLSHLKKLCLAYKDLFPRKDPQAEEPLDFSHIELFDLAPHFRKEPTAIIAEDIFEVLKTNPENLPAIWTTVKLLKNPYYDSQRETWLTAEKLMTGPIGKLALARHFEPRDSQVEGADIAERLLATGAPLAEDKSERADFLYKAVLYHSKTIFYHSMTKEQAKAMYDRALHVYLHYPDTEAAKKARNLAVDLAVRHCPPDRSLELIRTLQKRDDKNDENLLRSLYDVALAYTKEGQLDESEAILMELYQREPKTSLASRVAISLSEVYNKRDDEQGKIDWLKRCIELDVTEPTGQCIMDTDNTRSWATQRLAAIYEHKGEWKFALKYWELWEPNSWCGTCIMQMYQLRASHLTKCRAHLGRHDDVARNLLAEAFKLNGSSTTGSQLALYKLYRDADQLDDLHSMIKDYDAHVDQKLDALSAKESDGAKASQRWTRYYHKQLHENIDRATEIDTLAAENDIEGLIEICTAVDRFNLPNASLCHYDSVTDAQLAAEQLVALGEPAERKIVEMIDTTRTVKRWQIYVLAEVQTDRALEKLAQWLPRVKSDTFSEIFAWAISRYGEKGKEELQRLIETGDPDSNPVASAQGWLTLLNEKSGQPNREPIPRPAKSSLPKRWQPAEAKPANTLNNRGIVPSR